MYLSNFLPRSFAQSSRDFHQSALREHRGFLSSKEKRIEYIPTGKHEFLFILRDKDRAQILKDLELAAQYTPEGKEFIKNFKGNIYEYLNHPIGMTIYLHPNLQSNFRNHNYDLSSLQWALHNLHFIYNQGWDQWVKLMKK